MFPEQYVSIPVWFACGWLVLSIILLCIQLGLEMIALTCFLALNQDINDNSEPSLKHVTCGKSFPLGNKVTYNTTQTDSNAIASYVLTAPLPSVGPWFRRSIHNTSINATGDA